MKLCRVRQLTLVRFSDKHSIRSNNKNYSIPYRRIVELIEPPHFWCAVTIRRPTQ